MNQIRCEFVCDDPHLADNCTSVPTLRFNTTSRAVILLLAVLVEDLAVVIQRRGTVVSHRQAGR